MRVLLMAKSKVISNKSKEQEGDPDLIHLGKRIRSLRVKQGYNSAEKFALDNELSRVHYGRWEAGKKNITYKSLRTLAKAFKISLSEFFREIE